ncbi:4Fe-4S ferredoxin [Bacteroidia bacterium]|nr:4Fe-4S ferredoxin [Bacteroidia bacterium]
MSKVYFTDMRTKPGRSLPDKLELLVKRAGIETIDFKDKFTAVKIHFGEPGNLAYIRANYAARLVQFLLAKQAKPFLTDANTLYLGRRSNALDHITSAFENGFNPLAVPCPVIIADGLKAIDFAEIPLGLKHCKTAKIGAAIAESDIVVSMNHFKGHEQTGFGGALKNIGMGSASRQGKLELHSSSQPIIDAAECTSCGQCVKYCASKAIHLNADKKAEIDYKKCVGCGQCVAVCQFEAAQPVWDNSTDVMNYKIAEYALAVVKDKPHFHVSFIMDVSPNCDCWACNDAAIVPNIGIAASFDPVALDKACADMVTNAGANLNTVLNVKKQGELQNIEKFKLIHPNTDWLAGLKYAQEIGLGELNYELVKVE